MKTYFFKGIGHVVSLLITLCTLASFYTSNGFTINGHITGIGTGRAYLVREFNKQEITDSATIHDGFFTFKGSVPEPLTCYIRLPHYKQISFFIENSDITITGNIDSLNNAVIKGSHNEDVWKAYERSSAIIGKAASIYYKLTDSVYKSFGNTKPDVKAIASLEAAKAKLVALDFKVQMEFFNQHRESVICAYALLRHYTVPYLKTYSVAPLFKGLSSPVKQSYYGKQMQDILDAENHSDIGSHPNFTLNNAAGKPVNLSSFKGRYVLVDFWASWCAPCRKQNPTLTANYKKYHAKGLDIIGVSLDTDKAAWLKAIKSDGLSWIQVSDLKAWEQSAAVVYFGIDVIPANFLLDKDGKVIAKNIQEGELDLTLESIFNN